jgi:hypothetical protein
MSTVGCSTKAGAKPTIRSAREGRLKRTAARFEER